jgi:hypothetical protein
MSFTCRVCYRECESWEGPHGYTGGGTWCWDCCRAKRLKPEPYKCLRCGMPHYSVEAALRCCTEPEVMDKYLQDEE